jgi:hypothetical protein
MPLEGKPDEYVVVVASRSVAPRAIVIGAATIEIPAALIPVVVTAFTFSLAWKSQVFSKVRLPGWGAVHTTNMP